MKYKIYFIFSVLLTSLYSYAQNQPNILIVIADDMGIDVFEPYELGTDQPSTPNLEAVLNEGVQFNNAYAYAKCAPSRASIMTGRYGNKTGMMRSGPNMDYEERTMFEYIDSLTSGEYANALFGKWHLGNNVPERPNLQGIQHYDGNLKSGVDDYYHWARTINGVTDTSDNYVTTYITDQAINWVDTINGPWLLWMAYNAPHEPFHLPPDSLYTRTDTSNNNDKYICMIESIDHEFGRLYNSLSPETKDSTLVIFLGDNGTPGSKLQEYPNGHGKNSLYEGGIRVPMFMSGYGVERIGEEENGLVAAVDIFATVMESLGEEYEGGYHNSYSLTDVLKDPSAVARPYNYSELGDPPNITRAIRNEEYKLILFQDSVSSWMEFYDLVNDPLEFTDLLPGGLTTAQELILDELNAEADSIYFSWSCNDLIKNGDEEGIDCGGSSCAPCVDNVVENSSESINFTVSPNPFSDSFFINVEPEKYELRLRHASGTLVLKKQITGPSQINLSGFQSGIYFVELIHYDTGISSYKKICKSE